MNIAVYVPSRSGNAGSKFIVETFFPLFKQLAGHRFIIITSVSNDLTNVHGFELIFIKPQPRNVLLKKLWIEKSMARLLKKTDTDVFICADNFCLLNTSLPQILLLPDTEKLKQAYAKKAQLIIVTNESQRKKSIMNLPVRDQRIEVVHPSPGKLYIQFDEEEKASVKNKFSEGKEYFLYNSSFNKKDDLIGLLKSFSYFKKRQQSSFKLLLFERSNFSFEEAIDNYKYRDDIVIVKPENNDAEITAAAYAAVLPFNTDADIPAALNAMQSGVPVITTGDSLINEIAADGALYAANEIRDIGEKMMQLYKDESLRSRLAARGKDLVKKFTEEKCAGQLQQCIMKAMN